MVLGPFTQLVLGQLAPDLILKGLELLTVFTANDLDNTLLQKFGGKLFTDR